MTECVGGPRRRRRGVRGMLMVAAGLLLSGAAAPSGPLGRWLSEDGNGIVEIAPCPGGLCGRLVGMSSPFKPDGSPETDPDGVPTCRRTILHVAPTADGRWSGRIIDPETGDDWNCVLWLDPEGDLHLHGYVLIELLGSGQIWHRTAIAPAMDCSFPAR